MNDSVTVLLTAKAVYLNFTLFAFVVVALELRLQPIEQRVAVDVGTVNDHHLPEVEVTEQGGPHIRLMEERSYGPQERHVNVLFLFRHTNKEKNY